MKAEAEEAPAGVEDPGQGRAGRPLKPGDGTREDPRVPLADRLVAARLEEDVGLAARRRRAQRLPRDGAAAPATAKRAMLVCALPAPSVSVTRSR